jgi:hypothetical protein
MENDSRIISSDGLSIECGASVLCIIDGDLTHLVDNSIGDLLFFAAKVLVDLVENRTLSVVQLGSNSLSNAPCP